MQLDKHISHLLYKHNCVIISDFGGFVTNYKSAAIHPVQHTFTAPSKQVAFNRNLTTNDGLLANYISQKLSVSYTESCRIISNFVEVCNAELESGKKLVFDNVGELFFDREKNLQFVPQSEVNYLLDSFGLSPFQSPAIRREERRIELAGIEKAIPTIVHRKKKSKLWRLIEVVPVAAALTYFIINSSLTANLNASFAGLNPFANTNTEKVEATPATVNSPAAITYIEPATVKEEPAPVITTPPITVEKRDPVAITTKENNTTFKEEIVTPPLVIKPVLNTSANHSLFIIGGCFSVPENAQKFVQQLKNEGYPALILGKNTKGMDMVGIASAANRSKAEEMLGFIQESGYPDAWIFRKK